jgi:hypothetical protein
VPKVATVGGHDGGVQRRGRRRNAVVGACHRGT